MRGAVVVLGLVAAGCEPTDSVVDNGVSVWDMFPFDGEQTWEYLTNDPSVPYKLVAKTDGIAEVIDGKNVYTVRYTKDCVAYGEEECVTGDVVFQTRWSSDSIDGTFIHAYSVGAEATQFIELDPPVHFTLDAQTLDAELVTESSDGNTWTSRMLQNEECPIRLATVWETCGVFELTAAIGDGYPLAAKYWAAYGNGIAAFQHTNVLDPWELAKIEPCIDADNNPCDGNW